MNFTITKQDVIDRYGTAWSIPRQLFKEMSDHDLEVEITVEVIGAHYAQTLESPAEYPEGEITCVEMNGNVVGGELAEVLIVICGGEDDVISSAMEEMEHEAGMDAADAAMDYMEDFR